MGLIKIHAAENPLKSRSYDECKSKGQLKIAHIGNRQSIRHLIMPHIRRQLAEGNDVVAITSKGSLEIYQNGLVLEEIAFEEQRIHLFRDIAAFFRLVSAIRKHAPDVVHTHSVKFGIMGRWAARLAGVKYIVHTVHGIYEPFNATELHRQFILFLEKISNRLCDALAFVSKFNLEKYFERKLADPKKCFYVGNGIDLNRFDPARYAPSEVEAKKKELGIREGELVIGIVGRLVIDKGYYEFFETARALAQKIPNIRFLIIALSYQRNDSIAEEIAARYGVADKTIFLYDRTDMPLLYLAMDFLLHPSWREGFPRSLMEASALGVPCIASDIEGNHNVIEHGVTGWLTKPKDAQALTDACFRLVQNRNQAIKMSREARAKAKTEFNERVMLERLDGVYQSFLPLEDDLRIDLNSKQEVALA